MPIHRDKWFPCPMCGRPDSSLDGEVFCGRCEERYQRELKELERFRTDGELYDYWAQLNK